jgi:hypothetical protein
MYLTPSKKDSKNCLYRNVNMTNALISGLILTLLTPEGHFIYTRAVERSWADAQIREPLNLEPRTLNL